LRTSFPRGHPDGAVHVSGAEAGRCVASLGFRYLISMMSSARMSRNARKCASRSVRHRCRPGPRLTLRSICQAISGWSAHGGRWGREAAG
jgi:hypothetical protein